jgi:ATP-binding cassette subfamily B protein AbcA/BmrA
MLLRNGEIELEQWLAFFLFVPMINTVLRQMSMMWGSIKELQGRAARLGKLMMAPQEEMRADGSAEIPQGDVVFQSVSFGYQPEQPVLTDVELTIPRGKNTAIVGPSGSGKTTLLKLMEQLYQPTAGQISVGGVAVDTLNLSAWRKSLSYVTQDAVMFSGSVRECLTYGVQNAVTDEQLTAVTKLAGVYDYIQEQGGFDAQMSIWGSAMSGGQRQRMVIARELLKQADVLLLDEPTSALDAETAAGISDTIYQQFRGKTVVTVTHELSFISNADQIIVLDEGKVVDSGNHEELMQRCQIYRELVEEQSYQEVYGG